MGNLAKAFTDLDEHDELHARRSRAACRAKMGVRHANTIQSMYGLAKTYASLKRYEDALRLHQEALGAPEGEIAGRSLRRALQHVGSRLRSGQPGSHCRCVAHDR